MYGGLNFRIFSETTDMAIMVFFWVFSFVVLTDLSKYLRAYVFMLIYKLAIVQMKIMRQYLMCQPLNKQRKKIGSISIYLKSTREFLFLSTHPVFACVTLTSFLLRNGVASTIASKATFFSCRNVWVDFWTILFQVEKQHT